jgi:hypothetical protein
LCCSRTKNLLSLRVLILVLILPPGVQTILVPLSPLFAP